MIQRPCCNRSNATGLLEGLSKPTSAEPLTVYAIAQTRTLAPPGTANIFAPIMKPTAATRRNFLKTATGFAFSATAFKSLVPAPALAKQPEQAPEKRNFVHGDIWFVNIALDHPKLVPPVVQFAVWIKTRLQGSGHAPTCFGNGFRSSR